MSGVSVEDLDSLVRDLARAERSLRVARRALVTTTPPEDSLGPLESWRHVAGKRVYDALLVRPTSRADEALRASAARWVAEYTQIRTTWDLEVDEARAMRELPSTGPRAKKPDESFAREALVALLAEDAVPVAERDADRVARHGPRVRAARDERRSRLDEVARRLGRPGRFGRALVHRDTALAHAVAGASGGAATSAPPTGLVLDLSADMIAVLAAELSPSTPKTAPDDGLPGIDEATLVGSAARFLRATEPLARSVLTRAHRARTSRDGLAAVDTWRATSARETRGAEWPARLTGEWVSRCFAGLSEKKAASFSPPSPVGAGSFLRAAASYGEALHRQESLRYGPMALAHDPQFVDAHRTGALFALALGSVPFLVRELGSSRGTAMDASKALTTSMLFSARARATALLVASEGVSERVTETDAATGGPYARIAFVHPRPMDDEPARWLALLTSHEAHERLVATCDEDWYRNPRAARALSTRFALPALATTFLGPETPDLSATADSVARAFEKELG